MPARAGSVNLTDRLLPPTVIATMLAALYLVFVQVPTDSFQGPVQRIFYVHMAMWLATFSLAGSTCRARIGCATAIPTRSCEPDDSHRPLRI